MSSRLDTRAIDLESIAPNMLDAALAVTAGRMNLATKAQAFCRLAAGESAATTYFRHELGRQVAMALLLIDPQVLEIYEEQDSVIDEIGADPPVLFSPLRVLVRVCRQTAALRPVLDDLNGALCRAVSELLGRSLPRAVEFAVVADCDVWILAGRSHLHCAGPQLLAQRADLPAEMR
jgi:hypothetical protein